VATGTQGAAIDWWLRFLVDPAPSPSQLGTWFYYTWQAYDLYKRTES
jgi:hypothetical protein